MKPNEKLASGTLVMQMVDALIEELLERLTEKDAEINRLRGEIRRLEYRASIPGEY